MKIITLFLSTTIILASSCKSGKTSYEFPFQDPERPIEERVDDIVSRLTLEEKAWQMQNAAPAIDRLGIPEYNWWNECLHGVARAGEATVFPQAIGLAATFDEELIYRVADVISTEARAKHHEALRNGDYGQYKGLTMWSPNINIFRDPRWGRGQETYGEDPYLTSRLGVAFVKGLQGDDSDYLKVVSTPKHFAVHSGPEPLRHEFDAITNKTDLYETYLPAFEATVREGKAWSVMGAYNRYMGEPCCASHFLLQETLRDQWGFEGYVVSDCQGIKDIYAHHKVVETAEEAVAHAIKAGCDLNCGYEYHKLVEAVAKGYITEEEVDVSLKRLFEARFKLGMFDPVERVEYAQIPIEKNLAPEHRELALETARKSMVLLKNDGLLPLDREKIKKIAVVGPNADNKDIIIGNYNGTPVNPVTILEGIRNKAGDDIEVVYEPGCNHVLSGAINRLVPEEVLTHDGEAGLQAEYFNNTDLEGEPLLIRSDRNISSNWIREPVNGLNMESFSVRWSGTLTPKEGGKVILGLTGDDGYRLILDGKTVIEDWTSHGTQTQTAEIVLEKGKEYDLVVEYFENGWGEEITFNWGYPKNSDPKQIVAGLSDADVIIFAGGLSPRLEGEEMPVKIDGFAGGDRTKIELPAVQEDLVREIHSTGKPVVFVLSSGSAVSLEYAKENLPAIIASWYPGESAGTALADILFGDHNPSGRLPVTFYKDIDDLPPFEDYNMKGRTYRYFEAEVQFAFGFGLSYTSFSYDKIEINKNEAMPGENISVSVLVRNTGFRAGEEVVQMYIRDVDSNISYRPFKSLKGIQKVYLEPGESKEVSFDITPESLSLYDVNEDRYRVEAGKFEIMIGGSSSDEDQVAAALMIRNE